MKTALLILTIISIVLLTATMLFGYYLDRKVNELSNREKIMKIHVLISGISVKIATLTLILWLINIKRFS
ncbi:MAG: hypothetical protein JW737_08925 [Acidobacteria bacterium]|nr:hypothetical protein [Acidobacteriota bacterium]